MGKYANRTVVPAGHAAAVSLTADREFAIVDLEGGQVGDLFAFNRQNLSEFASASHTRVEIRRIVPQVGDIIYTNLRNQMLRVVSDSSPGRHDALVAACDARRYEMLGYPGHRSCASNLEEALASEFGGLRCPVPQPFNIFQVTNINQQENSLRTERAMSAPGDKIVFMTLMETVIVVSSCPQDILNVNSGGVTPLAIDY